jgi:hypothetical protein
VRDAGPRERQRQVPREGDAARGHSGSRYTTRMPGPISP